MPSAPLRSFAPPGRRASSVDSASGSSGFTRCESKPTSRERRRSSSCPQPVSAISTACLAPGLGADPSRDFVAIELRHADVEQHHIGVARRGDFERLSPIGSRVHFVPIALKKRRQAVQRIPIVIGQQNAMPAPRRRLPRRSARHHRHGIPIRPHPQRQPNEELAAMPRPLAIRRDAAPVHLNQAAARAQARCPGRPARDAPRHPPG